MLRTGSSTTSSFDCEADDEAFVPVAVMGLFSSLRTASLGKHNSSRSSLCKERQRHRQSRILIHVTLSEYNFP